MTTDYDDIYGSRFLAATDLKGPITVTVDRIEYEQFTRPGEPTRTKAVAYFKGGKKGMVINKTNAANLAAAFGKPFTGWVGKRVMLRVEQTMFAGKPTHGLRIYPANGGGAVPPPPVAPQPPPQQAPPLRDELNDEIPW
jgi:hypothetical protein